MQSLGEALMLLGNDLFTRGRAEDSFRVWGEAVSIFRFLVEEYPTIPTYRQSLADSVGNRAIGFTNGGRMDEAETDFREAVVIRRRLVTDYPSVVLHRLNLLQTLGNLGAVFHMEANTKKPSRS